MTREQELMEYLPNGVPRNDDTFCVLFSWIESNMAEAELWAAVPLTEDEETNLYYKLGRTIK